MGGPALTILRALLAYPPLVVYQPPHSAFRTKLLHSSNLWMEYTVAEFNVSCRLWGCAGFTGTQWSIILSFPSRLRGISEYKRWMV